MMRVRLFGIPLVADWWFFLGLVFLAQWAGGGRAGLIAAVAIGILTVVHELGHALLARHYGCEVAIRLNLLQGWASYSAPRPLTRGQRISISLAGPLAQLGAALPFLWLVHGPAVDSLRVYRSFPVGGVPLAVDLWVGLVWAGVVIALLNLLPLWPLDGGHVVEQVIATRLGDKRAQRTLAIGTLVACGLVLVGSFAASGSTGWLANERERAARAVGEGLRHSFGSAIWEQVRSFPGHLLTLPWLLLIFCGFASWSVLKHPAAGAALAGGRRGRLPVAETPDPAAVQAEQAGWMTGQPGAGPGAWPAGWEPSPWLRAHSALRRGDYPAAQLAMADLVRPGGRWVAPSPGRPELSSLVPVLPDPFPVDDPVRAAEVLAVRSYHGPPAPLLRLASSLYEQVGDPEILYVAASGLGRRGLADDAMAWLRRAAMEQPDRERLLADAGFVPLHARHDFQQLLDALRPAGAGTGA